MSEAKNIKINLSDDGLKIFEKVLRRALKLDQHQSSFTFRQAAEHADAGIIQIEDENTKFAVICSLISDLLEQGWLIKDFSINAKILTLSAPNYESREGESITDVKERIRSGLTAISNKQLASPNVQDFIGRMEKIRTYKKREVSVISLVDSGKELAKALRTATKSFPDDLETALGTIVEPMMQVCEEGAKCEKTGLYLQDIWRYFRHTWSLEYKPIPGRTMRVLIRNKARENWPIMGIAMLASPAMNLYVRDEWIGWRMEDIYDGLLNSKIKPKDVALCLFNVIKDALDNVRKDDIISRKDIEKPNDHTLMRLEQIANASKSARRNDLVNREDENNNPEEKKTVIDIRGTRDFAKINWKKLSATSLFKKKRAETLVPLLKAYWHFKGANIEKEPAAGLYALLSNKAGQEAVGTALNELRKIKLASQVADVSVCGAITPYNHLLAGKLVTILMGSEEVRRFYKKRYDGQLSEIASQVAGKPVTRSADLLVLTTTSLYGIGSSQYSRINLPADCVPGVVSGYKWEELELTKGFGVTHLSDETAALMRKLSHQVHGVRRVNSVFGEGSSPRMRQIRDALLILGITDSAILKHGMSRMVYAYEYYSGARSQLTGFSPIKNGKAPSAKSLSAAWIKRWVTARVQRKETLDALKSLDKEAVSIALKNRVIAYNDLHKSNEAIKHLSVKLFTQKKTGKVKRKAANKNKPKKKPLKKKLPKLRARR